MEAARSAGPLPVPARAFWHMLLLDALFYGLLLTRDYDDHGQSLVAHYIAFVVITDLGALFLPADSRQWFNVFRLTGSISLLTLTLALAAQDLNGAGPGVTTAQCVLAVVRMCHAGWLIKTCGPWIADLRNLPVRAAEYLRQGTGSEKLSLGFLVIAAGGLFFPQLIYWTHHNDGGAGLDATLTGMSAQNGLNVFIKMFVFEALIAGATRRLVLRGTVAVLFFAQILLMPAMYYSAPLPFAHFLAEAYLLVLVLAAYRSWRTPALPRPPVRSS